MSDKVCQRRFFYAVANRLITYRLIVYRLIIYRLIVYRLIIYRNAPVRKSLLPHTVHDVQHYRYYSSNCHGAKRWD